MAYMATLEPENDKSISYKLDKKLEKNTKNIFGGYFGG